MIIPLKCKFLTPGKKGKAYPNTVAVATVNTAVIQQPVCKYLGVMLDSKLSFGAHVDVVVKNLSTHCGNTSKLHHYSTSRNLILYYNSNIKLVIQYGILVYGFCSYSTAFI